MIESDAVMLMVMLLMTTMIDIHFFAEKHSSSTFLSILDSPM
jgi:hypothetical protein